MSEISRDNKHSSELTTDTEVQITTYLGYLEITICALFLIFRIFVPIDGATVIIALMQMGLFIYGTYMTKTTRNPKYGLYLHLPLIIFFIPYRMLTNGGLYSPEALWLCVLPVNFLVFYFRIASPAGIVLSILFLVGCYFLHLFGYITPPPTSLTTYLITFTTQTVAIFFVMMIIDQSRKRLEKQLSMLKNETTKNNMIATLNHEINNPLAIMSAKLQIAQGNKDWNMIISAQKEIDRINMTLLQIKEISGGNLSKSDYQQGENKPDNVQIYNLRN